MQFVCTGRVTNLRNVLGREGLAESVIARSMGVVVFWVGFLVIFFGGVGVGGGEGLAELDCMLLNTLVAFDRV